MNRRLLYSILLIIFAGVLTPARSADDVLPMWLLQTKLGGDFRYRNESIDNERVDNVNYRNRIRYRLWLKTQVNDRVAVGFRLASGHGDPRSTNQDLEDGFSGKPLVLDRAFMEVKPCKYLAILAGKYGLPYFKVSQLVWDSDINLEGVTAKLAKKSGTLKFSVLGGAYWVDERSTSDGKGLFAIQSAVTAKSDEFVSTFAVAYYDYTHLRRYSLIYSSHDGHGNHTMNYGLGPFYTHDFDLVSITGKHSHHLTQSMVFSLMFEIVRNTAINLDEMGVLGGFSLVQKHGMLPYKVAYNYRELEADAVVGMFTESDFAGGSTDTRGHKIWGTIEPIEDLALGITLYSNKLASSGTAPKYTRFMADAVVKF